MATWVGIRVSGGEGGDTKLGACPIENVLAPRMRSPVTSVVCNSARTLRTGGCPLNLVPSAVILVLRWCSSNSFSCPVQVTRSQQLSSFAVAKADTCSGCRDCGDGRGRWRGKVQEVPNPGGPASASSQAEKQCVKQTSQRGRL